eukprot:COSAG01_NODE_1873_length_8995_cov_7.542299_4_plen_59_part_00
MPYETLKADSMRSASHDGSGTATQALLSARTSSTVRLYYGSYVEYGSYSRYRHSLSSL